MRPCDLADFRLLAACWRAVMRSEAITLQMAAGGAVMLAGTALALGFFGAPRAAATAAAR